MKVLHVISQLTKGGGERIAVELANSFVRSGDQVTLLATFPVAPEFLQNEIDPLVDLRFVTSRPRSRVVTYMLAIRWLALNCALVSDQDIVHGHLTFGSFFGTLVVFCRNIWGRPRPKIIETYHSVGMPMSRTKWWIVSRLAKSHDGFVTMATDRRVSQFVRQHPRLIHAMIPNGIRLPFPRADLAESHRFRAAAGIPDRALVVGTLGRLVAERRPEMFIETFAQIAAIRPDVHFLMAGDGPERVRISQLAQQAGFGDRLHLPGLTLRPTLPFSVIDLYLTLNVGDITGIAALEAIASGLPAIALQAEATYADGKRDWIYSSPHPQEVAAEVVRLLNTPEELKTLAAAQRDVVLASHGLEGMAAAYRDFYEAVLVA